MLPHIDSQSRHTYLYIYCAEILGQGLTRLRIYDKKLISIDPYYHVVPLIAHQAGSLMGKECQTFFFGLDYQARDAGLELCIYPLAKVRDYLVFTIEKDTQVLTTELCTIVFHPLAQIDSSLRTIVIAQIFFILVSFYHYKSKTREMKMQIYQTIICRFTKNPYFCNYIYIYI